MGVGDIDRGFELFLAREPARLTPSVFVHNLRVFAAEIEHEYFPQPRYVAPVIQWGKSIGRKKRHSIRLGSYHRPSAVIRIHPRLNAPDVPHFFVKSIIHHEYLHHVLGPNHNRRFRRYERKFRFYRESKEWLRRHLPVLLGHRVTPLPHFERRPNRPVIQLGLFGI